MGKIFVSYRRDDSADVSGRIFDRLIEHFGRSAVFMDVDNIPPGVDFRDHIADAIGQSTVLLAIIGPNWCNSVNAEGERRLNDPSDFVRIEIESALERNVNVIPLLVRDAKVPPAVQLPESLRKLVYLNAPEVRSGHDFHSHVDRLIRKLEEVFGIQRYAKNESRSPGTETPAPVAASKGHCPKCSRNNPPERQFCGGCGEPLREPCFECDFVNEAVDVFCGNCGIDLAANRRARLDTMTTERERIEQLRQESRLYESIQRLMDMQRAKHLRLKSFAAWAATTLNTVQVEFDQLCATLFQRADQMFQNQQYDEAVQLLEQIPEPARKFHANNLLSRSKQEVARRLEREKAEAEEHRARRDELDTLRSKIEAEDPQAALVLLHDFKELAAAAVHRFGADDFQKDMDWSLLEMEMLLDKQRRLEQARADRLEQVRAANAHLKQHAITDALACLDKIPESLRTPDDQSLIVRLRRTKEELDQSTAEIGEAIRTAQYSLLPDAIRRYTRSKPLDKDLQKQLLPWFRYVRDTAQNHFASHRYAEVVATIDQIPESIRTHVFTDARSRAEQALAEIYKLKESIAQAREQRDVGRLISDLHRYLQLKPDYVQGREFLDKLLADCLRECKENFERGDYERCVQRAETVPSEFRGSELEKLHAQAKTTWTAQQACNSELSRALKSGDIRSWISAWARACELQPTEQFCDATIQGFLGEHPSESGKPTPVVSSEAMDYVKRFLRQIHQGDIPAAVGMMWETAERFPELQNSGGFEKLRDYVLQQYVGPIWRLSSESKPSCIAYAARANQLVIGCADGRILVVEPWSMRLLRQFSLGEGGVRHLAVSSDGKRVIALSRSGFREEFLCLIDEKGNVTQLKGHRKITCVAISPDGSLAASGGREDNAVIYIWEAARAKCLHKLSSVSIFSRDKAINAITALAFAVDGSTLVSCGKFGCSRIHLWDVKTGREKGIIPKQDSYFPSLAHVAISADASHIASVSEDSRELEIWNVERKSKVASLSNDAHVATFCADNRFVLWSSAHPTVQGLVIHRFDSQQEVWYQPLFAAPKIYPTKTYSEGEEFELALAGDLEEEPALPAVPSCKFGILGRDEIDRSPTGTMVDEMILLADGRRVVLRQGDSIVLWSIPAPDQFASLAERDREETQLAGPLSGKSPTHGDEWTTKLLAILTRQRRTHSRLLTIPIPGFQLAKASIHAHVPPGDRILAVMDCERNHDHNAFVFATTGAYYSNSNLGNTEYGYVPYQQLIRTEFSDTGNNIPFSKSLTFVIQNDSSPRWELVAILRDIQTLLRTEPGLTPPGGKRDMGLEVEQLFRRRLTFPLIDVFVVPDIPEGRLKNARASCRVPENEEIVALIDCTWNSSATDAFVFGLQGLYYHHPAESRKPGPGYVAYDDFARLEFTATGTHIDMGQGLELDMGRCSLSPSVFVEILTSIKQLISGVR